jgi:hypothetical protein
MKGKSYRFEIGLKKGKGKETALSFCNRTCGTQFTEKLGQMLGKLTVGEKGIDFPTLIRNSNTRNESGKCAACGAELPKEEPKTAKIRHAFRVDDEAEPVIPGYSAE